MLLPETIRLISVMILFVFFYWVPWVIRVRSLLSAELSVIVFSCGPSWMLTQEREIFFLLDVAVSILSGPLNRFLFDPLGFLR